MLLVVSTIGGIDLLHYTMSKSAVLVVVRFIPTALLINERKRIFPTLGNGSCEVDGTYLIWILRMQGGVEFYLT